ncbi:MAG: hypothetical protein OXH70_17625 [Acidobacteria bacterium]|nr:hypothetical protein [Acidobacteriota bacterium]
MSEHFFGLGSGRVPDHVAVAVDAVAKRHDAHLVRYQDPASGPRYWFACPNRGAPFDGATAAAVLTDLESAGLWDGERLIVDVDSDELREVLDRAQAAIDVAREALA